MRIGVTGTKPAGVGAGTGAVTAGAAGAVAQASITVNSASIDCEELHQVRTGRLGQVDAVDAEPVGMALRKRVPVGQIKLGMIEEFVAQGLVVRAERSGEGDAARTDIAHVFDVREPEHSLHALRQRLRRDGLDGIVDA